MHLERIQIPEFRALKKVDITFEKDFIPKVFPLCGENGSGKSTLLRYIFVLLSGKKGLKRELIANYSFSTKEPIAKMDIWDGKKTNHIDFSQSDDGLDSPFLKELSQKVFIIGPYFDISYLNKDKGLGHGKRRREYLYTLINRYPNGSIVLIDEIENGLHPDWQYQIVEELTRWGPNNQYILATHSYELCQAVTPSHVKEIN